MPLYLGRATAPEYAQLDVKPKKLFHNHKHTMIQIFGGPRLDQKTRTNTTRAEYGFYVPGWFYYGTDQQWHRFH